MIGSRPLRGPGSKARVEQVAKELQLSLHPEKIFEDVEPKKHKRKELMNYRGYKQRNRYMSYFQKRGLIRKLLDWAASDGAVHLGQFCQQFDITEMSLEMLAHKDKELGDAYADALELLSSRREIGMIFKKIDGEYINHDILFKMQAMMCRRHREFLVWRTRLHEDVVRAGIRYVTLYTSPEEWDQVQEWFDDVPHMRDNFVKWNAKRALKKENDAEE